MVILIINIIWPGTNHKDTGKIINQENINNQFIDKFKDVEGSKIENKLVIILIFFFL